MSDSCPAKLGRLGAACLMLLAVAACGKSGPTDYGAYRAQMPASILVLPPTNQSVEVNAPYSYLSTITRPIAEAGYYVFPVAVVDAYMKENGLPTPADMHGVPLEKLDEVFGPDAVLYVDIEAYGQEYQLLSSAAVVRANAKLVDVDTGTTIWDGKINAAHSSGGGGSNLLVALIGAAISQAVGTTVDASHGVAVTANRKLFSGRRGLLLGPYHPRYEEDGRGREDVVEAVSR